MRRRTRSPKGARGAAATAARGGRGRGRARGGGKGKSGRGGGKSVDRNISGDNDTGASDCVNIIKKDSHSHRSITSGHFSRTLNGSVGYSRGEHVLQLGGIPRRPVVGPAQHNGHNNNSSNNHSLNNNPGNDFYLHKKFKKVTSTVDAVPSVSSSESDARVGGPVANNFPETSSHNSNSCNNSNSSATSVSTNSNSTSSIAAGMVYKPKFRIKSELELGQSAAQEQSDSPVIKSTTLLSPKGKVSPVPSAPEPEPLFLRKSMSIPSDVPVDMHMRIRDISVNSSISMNNSIIVSSKMISSPLSTAGRSEYSSISQNLPMEPAKLCKDVRLDRKSLDDRISKIIDENQSILEWPEQFTKMLKNHTARSQNPHQRTNHLLSGGSTTELPVTSPSSYSHHNGLLRHSSTSSEMSTSGGSVELLMTASQNNNSLLNTNGTGRGSGIEPLSFQHVLSNSEIHNFSMSGGSATLPTIPAPTPTDLSFTGAHSGSTVTTLVRPSSASSTGSASSTTSSMVPKKRRRLSPTPSRLCGGEVSELPVNEAAGGKNYFQDVDMTVRVSNCGPSGAKVTIRTNNGTVSGGSVQTAATGLTTPVNFTKMIDHSHHHTPSPNEVGKPVVNGAIFFPGPGPLSPSTIVPGNKPLSLVTSNKNKLDVSTVSPLATKKSSLFPSPNSESQKPSKGTRGRPPRKKSVPETVIPVDSPAFVPTDNSILKIAPHASEEIPSRIDSTEILKRPCPSTSSNTLDPSPSPTSLHASSLCHNNSFPSQRTIQETNKLTPTQLTLRAEGDSVLSKESEQCSSLTTAKTNCPKSENSNPEFQVVPTPTQNPKRPTFLALKPVNTNSKKTEPGVLPSPETPRVAKPYNQMSINGQAYTYLGFKVSTRSSYTCLFKTQPMFIPQESDPKLSMYTNWQPRPRDPNQVQIGISTNDSRVNGRKSPHNILYTSANRKNCDTLTVSSPDNQLPISSPVCEGKSFLSGIEDKVSISESDTNNEPRCSSKSSGIVTEARPGSSASLQAARLQSKTQPIQIQVPHSPNSGIVPISPPSQPSSPVSFVSGNNRGVGSGGLMSIAAFSPKSGNVMNMSSRDNKSKTSPSLMSSSDTSSMDESSSFGRRRSILKGCDDDGESNPGDGPYSLGGGKDDSSCSPNGRYDSNRVKIMEGGFESNEDYTYVRGRGRGRYVCEACGIRCKKPSMLRKHLKTHTDLRPYTCKLCNFSFKTKGNLTKHQKSKSHHKKCAGLGIHPESSTSLAMTGPAFSISDTNTTDDNESDDDFDDNGDQDIETDSQDECDGDSGDCNENGSESVEKEIAQSLLDLSKATVRLPSGGSTSSDYESSNDARVKNIKSSYPYNSMIEDISNSSVGSFTGGGGDNGPAPEIPMDLSVKPSEKHSFEPESDRRESDNKRIKMEKNGLIKSVGVVKEAEAWQPIVDEESRCLNLRKVLNSTEVSPPLEISEQRVTQLIKKEKDDGPPNTNDHLQTSLFYGPRQRTESEASTCSIGSNSIGNTVPITEAVSSSKQFSLSTPSQSTAGTSSGTVKLHQPWLSPSEPKDNKQESSTDVPTVEESKPVTIVAEMSPFKSSDEAEIQPRETPGVPTAAGPSLPPANLDSVVMSNSKLFSGLSNMKPQAEFRQPSGPQSLLKDEGKAECNVCGKTFARASQLTLHMNIHYIERPFRCDPCGVSFRTKGHLIKHRRSSSHDCKVYLTEAWGVANEENPRPFKCPDCKIAFRIHGHLAKHLRSKMHIMRMECLGKLPFGIYFEMEKSGINLNEIDTTDCDMSLVSLQNVARKIYGDQWRDRLSAPVEEPPA